MLDCLTCACLGGFAGFLLAFLFIFALFCSDVDSDISHSSEKRRTFYGHGCKKGWEYPYTIEEIKQLKGGEI